jgi:hypothetical protein
MGHVTVQPPVVNMQDCYAACERQYGANASALTSAGWWLSKKKLNDDNADPRSPQDNSWCDL